MTAATAADPTLRPIKNIGSAIDEMFTLREKKRVLESEVAKIEAQYAEIEASLMAKLDAEGTRKSEGKLAGVSITSTIAGNVVDWDALNAYIKRTGYFHLYQRRVSDPACRELFESKGKIPGVEPFTRRRLNLRVL